MGGLVGDSISETRQSAILKKFTLSILIVFFSAIPVWALIKGSYSSPSTQDLGFNAKKNLFRKAALDGYVIGLRNDVFAESEDKHTRGEAIVWGTFDRINQEQTNHGKIGQSEQYKSAKINSTTGKEMDGTIISAGDYIKTVFEIDRSMAINFYQEGFQSFSDFIHELKHVERGKKFTDDQDHSDLQVLHKMKKNRGDLIPYFNHEGEFLYNWSIKKRADTFQATYGVKVIGIRPVDYGRLWFAIYLQDISTKNLFVGQFIFVSSLPRNRIIRKLNNDFEKIFRNLIEKDQSKQLLPMNKEDQTEKLDEKYSSYLKKKSKIKGEKNPEIKEDKSEAYLKWGAMQYQKKKPYVAMLAYEEAFSMIPENKIIRRFGIELSFAMCWYDAQRSQKGRLMALKAIEEILRQNVLNELDRAKLVDHFNGLQYERGTIGIRLRALNERFGFLREEYAPESATRKW